MTRKLRISIQVDGLDDEGTVVQPGAFNAAFDADILAMINPKQPAGSGKGLSQVFILPDAAAGKFNLLSYSISGGQAINFSFLHAEDPAQLGEHMRASGVPVESFNAWNRHYPGSVIPVETNAVTTEVADLIKGLRLKPADKGKDGPA